MKGTVRILAGLALAFLFWTTALAEDSSPQVSAAAPTLVQVGVIDALLAGGYEGSMTLGQLRSLGDLGLGTFNDLDGEMVVLDGVVHQVLASGQVLRPADSLTTPFAQVTRLSAPKNVGLPAGVDLKAVEAGLDAALGDLNCFAAVRVDGRFATVTARSVPRQTPPYRPLAEVAKQQSVFAFSNAEGTLVGLRGPAFVRGLGVPGWHWHFLIKDRTRGGHVLAFVLDSAAPVQARLQTLRRLELVLPQQGLSGLDLGRDRTKELHAVEAPQ